MKRILPPTYFFIAIVLMVLIHFLIPSMELIPYPYILLGLIPLFAGIVFNMMADKSLKQYDTTVKPFEHSSSLVTVGVYRYSRNPMYLGMILILAGFAVLFGSLYEWVIVVAMAALFEFMFIRPEEKMLESTFGDMFREYRENCRKWV